MHKGSIYSNSGIASNGAQSASGLSRIGSLFGGIVSLEAEGTNPTGAPRLLLVHGEIEASVAVEQDQGVVEEGDRQLGPECPAALAPDLFYQAEAGGLCIAGVLAAAVATIDRITVFVALLEVLEL